MSFMGFNCKRCGKPFFVLPNTPQNILDDSASIKRYKKKGFEFVKIPTETVADIDLWCKGKKCKG